MLCQCTAAALHWHGNSAKCAQLGTLKQVCWCHATHTRLIAGCLCIFTPFNMLQLNMLRLESSQHAAIQPSCLRSGSKFAIEVIRHSCCLTAASESDASAGFQPGAPGTISGVSPARHNNTWPMQYSGPSAAIAPLLYHTCNAKHQVGAAPVSRRFECSRLQLLL